MTAFTRPGCIRSPTHRSLHVHFCEFLVQLPQRAGSPEKYFYLINTVVIFDSIMRWVESSDFGPKSDDFGHRNDKSGFIPSGFAKRRAAYEAGPSFFQMEKQNQKLGIGSH